MTKRRAFALAVAVCATTLTVAVGAAIAAGGLTPSQAPGVVVGQHYFGNTGHDPISPIVYGTNTAFDFWKLPALLSNDVVTVAWSSQARDNLLCIGENFDDYSWGDHSCNGSNRFEVSNTGSSRDLISVKAPSASAYLQVSGDFMNGMYDDRGPYDFTVESIQHQLGVNLQRIFALARNGLVKGSAVLSDGSAVPDGAVFVLHASYRGGQKTVGAKTSGGKGQLVFKLKLPVAVHKARKVITLTITRAQDGQYQAGRSASLKVKG
jgi:hypothetical protein